MLDRYVLVSSIVSGLVIFVECLFLLCGVKGSERYLFLFVGLGRGVDVYLFIL